MKKNLIAILFIMSFILCGGAIASGAPASFAAGGEKQVQPTAQVPEKDLVVSVEQVEAFTLTLIQNTRNWDSVAPYLPYVTGAHIAELVELVKPWYQPDVSKYPKSGDTVLSKEPLTRGLVGYSARALMIDSGNWEYVRPLLPFMTPEAVQEISDLYFSHTSHSGQTAVPAGPSSTPVTGKEEPVATPQPGSSAGGFDYSVFNRLDSMTQEEADALALSYIAATKQFGHVYNFSPRMSTAGIDAAVNAFLDQGGDIGIVGAILPDMSREAARAVAQKYDKEKTDSSLDWIFSSYR